MLTKSFLRDIINKLTDVRTEYGMERWLSWSKAHDWKSCKDLNSFEGSNPSLSAKQKEHTKRCALFVWRKGIRTSRPNKQSGGLFVGEGFSAEKRIPLSAKYERALSAWTGLFCFAVFSFAAGCLRFAETATRSSPRRRFLFLAIFRT